MFYSTFTSSLYELILVFSNISSIDLVLAATNTFKRGNETIFADFLV